MAKDEKEKDEAGQQEAAAGQEKASKSGFVSGMLIGFLICMAAVTLVWFLAPTVLIRGKGKPVACAEAQAKKKKGEHGAEATELTITGLVVNPAGAAGEHVLLVSVAVRAKDAESLEGIKSHENEIRDKLSVFFGTLSVEDLGNALRRAEFERAAATLIKDVVGKEPASISMPQFVVQ